MANILVGKIIHYYDKIQVAVLQVDKGTVKVGAEIMIGEEGEGFTQKVESMQVNHQQVEEIKAGEEAGLKVEKEVKEGDKVYLVTV